MSRAGNSFTEEEIAVVRALFEAALLRQPVSIAIVRNPAFGHVQSKFVSMHRLVRGERELSQKPRTE